MVLVISSGPLAGPTTPNELVAALLDDTELQAATAAFLARGGDAVPALRRSACALMGEEALVAFNGGGVDGAAAGGGAAGGGAASGGEWHVGSVDATTCLIVVALCRQSRMAWAAHYNSYFAARDSSISQLLPRAMTHPEVYLVGSYCEASGESLATLRTVLLALHACPLRFTVRLACVDAANTDAQGRPRALSLAVRCSDGDASPAGFADRGPEVPRRFAHDLVAEDEATAADESPGSSAHVGSAGADADAGVEGGGGGGGGAATEAGAAAAACGGWLWGGALRWIVHTPTGRLRIPGMRVSSRAVCKPIIFYHVHRLCIPDSELLACSSTSPAHEPPHFPEDIRAQDRWVLQLAHDGVQNVPDAWYQWREGEGWVAAQPLHAPAAAAGATAVEATAVA